MSWEFFSPGPSPAGYGTSLPGSPYDGQQYILVDSVTVPTYQWTFRYNAGSSNTDKWEFIGGSPAFARILTSEATSSTTYTALTTAGPSITVPRAGVYNVSIGMECNRSSGAASMSGIMSYDIGGTGASDNDAIYGMGHDNNTTGYSSPSGTVQQTLAASTALVSKYKATTQTLSFSRRWMSVVPVRCS